MYTDDLGSLRCDRHYDGMIGKLYHQNGRTGFDESQIYVQTMGPPLMSLWDTWVRCKEVAKIRRKTTMVVILSPYSLSGAAENVPELMRGPSHVGRRKLLGVLSHRDSPIIVLTP